MRKFVAMHNALIMSAAVKADELRRFCGKEERMRSVWLAERVSCGDWVGRGVGGGGWVRD